MLDMVLDLSSENYYVSNTTMNRRFVAGIAWGVMGAAEECFRISREYTLDRKQFGYERFSCLFICSILRFF